MIPDYLKSAVTVPVDLTREETLGAMNTRWRNVESGRLQLFFRGEWWDIARTDLLDDICTLAPDIRDMSFWISKVKYGARLFTDERGKKTFAIIDSTTDG